MNNKIDPRPMRSRIEQDIEPTGPYATVVACLHVQASKPLTKRIEALVTAALTKAHGEDDWDVCLTRSAGMTSIEWGGYSRSQGNRGHSILLSHKTTSEPIAQRYLDDMDRFLAAKHERNARRAALLASDVPERMDKARSAIVVAVAELEAVHDDDSNWSILPSVRTLVEEVLG